jgi:hypothetical protein
LSLFVLSLSTAGAGGILTARVFDRITNAQELYAQQLSVPAGDQTHGASSDRGRMTESLKSIGAAILLFAALATALFPTLPSQVVLGIASHTPP